MLENLFTRRVIRLNHACGRPPRVSKRLQTRADSGIVTTLPVPSPVNGRPRQPTTAAPPPPS